MNQEYSHINYPVITDENLSIMEPHIYMEATIKSRDLGIVAFQSRKQDMIYIYISRTEVMLMGKSNKLVKLNCHIPYQFSFQLLSKLIDVLW